MKSWSCSSHVKCFHIVFIIVRNATRSKNYPGSIWILWMFAADFGLPRVQFPLGSWNAVEVFCGCFSSVSSVPLSFFQVEGRAEDGGSSLTIMGNQPTQKKITDKVVVVAWIPMTKNPWNTWQNGHGSHGRNRFERRRSWWVWRTPRAACQRIQSFYLACRSISLHAKATKKFLDCDGLW